MKHALILFVSVPLLLATTGVYAYPQGCEVSGFSYQNPFLILNDTGKQTFYLIQNKSKTTIELQRHETREVFMSPLLSAKINASNWSAFASDVPSFHFACFIHEKKEVIPVACSEVLDICQYPRVKFALSNMGNYWVAVNQGQKQIIKAAIAKGILLKW
ncbi:MAG: enhanced entry protein EnhB [Legionellaceae bacterium]|nr:enhanced entry protein EnhB [Legionellaceae bacterium]